MPASSTRSTARAAPPGCSSSGRTTRTWSSTAWGTCRRSRTARRSTSCPRETCPRLDLGVGFPVGGTTPPEANGVRASARSARELDAVHWDEHRSFNRAGPAEGRDAGYLLPPIPTMQTVDSAVAHIGRFRAEFDRPFLVETPTNYLRPVPGDLTDGQFAAQIADRADCGILLRPHIIWAKERNGRQRASDFLAEIALGRVWEVHLAGGFTLDGRTDTAQPARSPVRGRAALAPVARPRRAAGGARAAARTGRTAERMAGRTERRLRIWLATRFADARLGELDEQQPGAPEEADRAQERAAVGEAG